MLLDRLRQLKILGIASERRVPWLVLIIWRMTSFTLLLYGLIKIIQLFTDWFVFDLPYVVACSALYAWVTRGKQG